MGGYQLCIIIIIIVIPEQLKMKLYHPPTSVLFKIVIFLKLYNAQVFKG